MSPLRILVAHAQYRQRGGEDVVAEQEAELLERRGHAVLSFTRSNQEIDERRLLRTAFRTLWSAQTTAQIADTIDRFKPDVLHVHNTFPFLSPSIYWAARGRSVPVVQTLHNFRLLCPQAMLLRDGAVCESCVGRVPWRAVMHRCYQQSLPRSAVVASMLAVHRSLGTYERCVTRFIALNEFCRRKFVAGGLPAANIAVKPNFADVPPPNDVPRHGPLFVGRITKEKGVDLLLDALSQLPTTALDVIGAGPESEQLAKHPRIRMHGWLTADRLFAVMRTHEYLLMPSLWYENSPRTLIEAFGCALPVIASRLGALAELIDDGRTGLLFDPGSSADLARKIRWAEQHPDAMRRMGNAARREFETRYSPDINYGQLLDIYRRAIDSHLEQAA